MQATGGGTITVTKSAGTSTVGTWSSFTKIANTGSAVSEIQVFWALVTGTGSCTIQAAHTNQDLGFHIYEFNPGAAGTITAESGQGVFQGNNVTSVSTAVTSSLTATDHDLLFSAGGTENSTETFTSIPLADGNTQQGSQSSAACYQLDSGTAGTYTASWTVGTADTRLVWVEVAFKFVASGGGSTFFFRKTLSKVGTRTGSRQVHN